MSGRATSRKRRCEGESSFTNKKSKNTKDRTHQPWAMDLPAFKLSEGTCQWSLWHQGGPNLTLPQTSQNEAEFDTRVSEALDAAGGKSFSKENLGKAKRWLCFRGIAVSEAAPGSELTPTQH